MIINYENYKIPAANGTHEPEEFFDVFWFLRMAYRISMLYFISLAQTFSTISSILFEAMQINSY